MTSVFLLAVGAYRSILTNHLGGACRFEPSCSEYAVDALKIHPPYRALILICKRILSCRPGGRFGYDPVPHLHQEDCCARATR
ncbi:MAG: membrane protein insertion efficiency factor YidD [Proteobacteria bacterium]|nr:membrane protein insertion efficiency factor YidD [Pseudomonadota bacterium]